MKTLKERLLYAMDRYKKITGKDVDQKILASAVNTTQQTISKMLTKSKTSQFIIPISKFLLIPDPEWLRTGEGAIPPLHPSPSTVNLKISEFPQIMEVIKIPVIAWDKLLIFRDGKLSMDEITEYTYSTDTSLLNCAALVIQNDEMTSSNPAESYMRGEIIIVDLKEQHRVNDFVVAHLKNSDGLMFKQYIKHADKYYLKSLNPQYPLIEVTDDIEIVGVMMEAHSVRKNKR